MSNKLLMKVTISQPGGISSRNYLYMSVREDEHGTLSYSLASMSGQGHSMSNLQTRCPLPTWHSPAAGTLISQIRSVLRNSVYQYESVEYPPKPKPAAPASGYVWVIDEESANYSWRVIALTEAGCLKEFKSMWNIWVKNTGADPYYWGHKGDKFGDVSPSRVPLGVGYMDREVFK